MLMEGSFLLKLFGVLLGTFIIIIAWYRRRFSHWKNLGVPYHEPTIPFGNAAENLRQEVSVGDWLGNLYLEMRARKFKHAGTYSFHIPLYVPLDLDVIKRIVQTDFTHFTNHVGYINERDDPLSAHIFFLPGERWRKLRVKLTPTFTSGKMKMMFPIMVKISRELTETLGRECEDGSPIDLKDISARFTTDVIGNCAFGIDCNSLKDPKAEFRAQGRRIFALTRMDMLRNFVMFFCPGISKFLRLRALPKVASDFFWNVIKETVEYRIANGVRRNDAMQLLIDMMRKEGETDDNSLTFSELAAQAFVFFIAGFETSSTLMSFALVELSLDQAIQDRLREEVNRVLDNNDGELTYEGLQDMHYLDMVINALSRECTKDYLVPGTDVVLKKGDGVFIPVKGIHYDPEYYPDPNRFDPNRFTEENKSKRHQFAHLPFGEGPRMCLGIRFGLMQAKVGLASMIRDFRFKLDPRTEMPVKLDKMGFFTIAESPLWTDVEKIN